MSNKIKHFYEFGEFRFSPEEKCLWRNEELLSLSPKALEVLNVLLKKPNDVVTREELLESVWEDTFVDEGNLTVAISNLRKTLGENGTTQFIQTVPTKGYRFVAGVEEVFEDENGEALEDLQTAGVKAGRSETTAPNLEESRSKVRWHFVAIVLLGVLFLSSFTLWLSYSGDSGLSPIPVNERNIKSIAVLPLKNLSGKNKTLSIGLTDNLISRLGKLNRFAVRPLSAVEKFTESGKDALGFGRDLRVDAVVVGTIQTDNRRLRLNVQLLDVRDGAQIWSKSFDRTETDLFRLQDDLSVQVATNLVSKLSDKDNQKLTQKETENVEAFQDYSKGQFYLAKRTPSDIEKAIGFFEKAIEHDENYASAYTNLADCYLLLSDSVLGHFKPMENAEKIRNAINRSVKLNPNAAEIYSTKGFLEFNIEWDVEAAQASYKKSIAMNPNLAQTRQWYGWTLLAKKRFTEAEKEMKLAQQLDPTSRIIAVEVGLPLLYSGKYKESLPHFRQAVEMDGNFFQARFRLWYALHFSKKYDEAFEELKAMKKLSSATAPFYLVPYGMTLATTGKRNAARRILDQLAGRKKNGEYIMPVLLASLAAALEENDQVFKWFDEARKERNDYLLYIEVAPEYKKLHEDPRFKKLVTEVSGSRSS